jgi:hypothetical protein
VNVRAGIAATVTKTKFQTEKGEKMKAVANPWIKIVFLVSMCFIHLFSFPDLSVAADDEIPVHFQAVVDLAAPDTAGTLAFYQRWIDDADWIPGSSFQVFGYQNNISKLLFSTTIPDRWGAGVLRAKAIYRLTARKRLIESLDGTSIPHVTDGSPLDGKGKIVIMIPKGMRNPEKIGNYNPENAVHAVVLVDLSDSPSGRYPVMAAYDHWLSMTGLVPGSRFDLMLIGQSAASVKTAYSVIVPADSPGAAVASLLAKRENLSEFIGKLTPGQLPRSSAIIAAMHVAGRYLKQQVGRKRLLYMFSDGRDVRPGAWNLEREVPDPKVFISKLQQSNMICPDMSDIDIVLDGLYQAENALSLNKLDILWRSIFNAVHCPAAVIRYAMPKQIDLAKVLQ